MPLPICSMPAETLVDPPYGLTPKSVRLALPALVRPAAPATAALIVASALAVMTDGEPDSVSVLFWTTNPTVSKVRF